MLPNLYVLKKEVFNHQMHDWMLYIGWEYQSSPKASIFDEPHFVDRHFDLDQIPVARTVRRKLPNGRIHEYCDHKKLTTGMRIMFKVLTRAMRMNPNWKEDFHLQDLPSWREYAEDLNRQISSFKKISEAGISGYLSGAKEGRLC